MLRDELTISLIFWHVSHDYVTVSRIIRYQRNEDLPNVIECSINVTVQT